MVDNGLNKKLKMYLVDLAIKHGINEFAGQWYSSAQNLEKQLKDKGIKLPKKIFYEYKMPRGMSQQEYMLELLVESFCYGVDIESWYPRNVVMQDENLSPEEKEEIFTKLHACHDAYTEKQKSDFQEILRLNPELKSVSVKKEFRIGSAIGGIVFGFAPAELAYFINMEERDYDAEAKRMETIEKFGVKVGYILAPETAKMVIAALQQNMQNKNGGRVVI